MKYLYIFVLLLVACDTTNECHQFPVTISDALPIQFWLVDCDTYNEKEVCGVHHKCWCQPWNCEDEISIQFSSEDSTDYVLRAINEDGETVDEVDFEITEFLNDPFSELLFANWENIETTNGVAWTIDATPSVSLPSTGLPTPVSDFLSTPISNVLSGTYDLSYNFNLTISDIGLVTFRFLKDGVSVGSEVLFYASGGSKIGSASITITDVPDEFRVGFSIGALVTFETGTLTLNEMFSMPSYIREPVYSTNYTAACNERISLQIVDVGVSPEAIIAKSDCIDVRTSHDCTTLIEYSNNRNFAGLVYENISPAQTFRILAPAIFFHERFPEEDNVIELTNSIIKTSGQLKSQRLFETDYIPYYMHRKLQLILKHQSVYIDRTYWTKEESYEIQDGERRWPVKKAKCFITEKNYVQRAIL